LYKTLIITNILIRQPANWDRRERDFKTSVFDELVMREMVPFVTLQLLVEFCRQQGWEKLLWRTSGAGRLCSCW